jgi:GNAT superfamily N-acetyltransferase
VTGPDPVGLETIEAAAIADAFGADAVQAGGVVCAVRPDLDEVYINRVIGLGVLEPASDAVLDRIADVFGSIRHSVALAPCAQPPDLPDMLRERGYEAGYAWVKFHRPAGPPPAAKTDLRVERIGAERSADYVAVLAAGFDLLPEAAGAVFVSGDHAWLGQATTLPEHRRRGGQSALMAARIGEARAAGAAVVVTEKGETVDGRPANSYHNILRAGFEPAYVRPNFISPPEDAIA